MRDKLCDPSATCLGKVLKLDGWECNLLLYVYSHLRWEFFIEEVEHIFLTKVRKVIINFLVELIFNLHNMAAMNYQCGSGGGLILYQASFIKEERHRLNSNVIFCYGNDNIV